MFQFSYPEVCHYSIIMSVCGGEEKKIDYSYLTFIPYKP